MPDSNLYIHLIVFVVSLSICALLSFLETCVTALRFFKLKELSENPNAGRYSAFLKSLEEDPNRVLNTILVSINLADTTAVATGSVVLAEAFADLPDGVGASLSVFVLSVVTLILGEIIPKNVAKKRGETLFMSTLGLANLVYHLLHPIVTVIMKLADFVVDKTIGTTPEATEFVTSEKEIQFLINYINEKGLMEPDKTSMLKSIFELGTTAVRDIMIPATSITSIEAHTSIKDAVAVFSKYQFSRFPMYEGTPDNVIGMLHFKDLFLHLSQDEQRPVKDIARPIMFIPESIKVNQLLRELKQQHMHIAMVIDEYGGIVGLVTLEDVLEEIVGEIRDEYESVTEKVIALKPGGWLVDASIELEQLMPLLNITFEREGALTLGGFLTERLQHLPKKGERFEYKGYTFQIQQASSKRVFQVLIFADFARDEFIDFEE